MILGMSTGTYTVLHVLISLAGAASGLVVLHGLLTARRLDRWTAVFLVTTMATSVTGFGFPFQKLLPSHLAGAISLLVLAVAVLARYGFQLDGRWRSIYVVSAMLALYLNVFVLIAQLFAKVPALRAMAPTQKESPFAVSQLMVFVLFAGLTVVAATRFRIEPEYRASYKRAA